MFLKQIVVTSVQTSSWQNTQPRVRTYKAPYPSSDLIRLNGEINAATLNLDPQPIAADDNKNLFRLRPHEEEHTITELALMHFLQPPALNYKCSFYDR